MSKIEAGMMELHYGEFELERLAIEAMATSQGLVGSKPVQLQSHVDPDVGAISADRTRIMQVLLNLLSNAIKFTDEGFVIMNIRRLKEPEGDVLQISVQDSGIGIKPEDIPQVFEQFRQIGGIEHRKAGGTGLGMPISKQLVEMHGGKIWLESTYGHGTTFYFTIPYTRPDHEGSGKAKGYYN
jgi:signal transduction histidine kinase